MECSAKDLSAVVPFVVHGRSLELAHKDFLIVCKTKKIPICHVKVPELDDRRLANKKKLALGNMWSDLESGFEFCVNN